MPFQTILSHIKLGNLFLYSTLTYWGNLYFCIFFFSCSPELHDDARNGRGREVVDG